MWPEVRDLWMTYDWSPSSTRLKPCTPICDDASSRTSRGDKLACLGLCVQTAVKVDKNTYMVSHGLKPHIPLRAKTAHWNCLILRQTQKLAFSIDLPHISEWYYGQLYTKTMVCLRISLDKPVQWRHLSLSLYKICLIIYTYILYDFLWYMYYRYIYYWYIYSLMLLLSSLP